MLKILITITLILILTTSIYSQIVDARFGSFGGRGFRGFGGFGGFGGGGAKSFSSHSVPLGTGQGKTFATSPSGKISSPQETTQSASKQSTPSSSSSSNNPQSNFQSQGPQSQFQQQPRSGFFGGGFGGGGFGGFGSMLMSSIMGNFIGQALFGWMFPHPAQVVAPAAPAAPAPSTIQAPAQKIVNNTTAPNNSTFKTPYQDQQFSSSSIKK